MISPVDEAIDESATMLAVCVGTGFPQLSISWSLDGSPLENNSRVSIYEEVIEESGITFVQSFLVVCSVGFMDAGLYQCTVANRLVNASSNFTLTVNRAAGKPSIVYLCFSFIALMILHCALMATVHSVVGKLTLIASIIIIIPLQKQ